jgi:hypothetical protein
MNIETILRDIDTNKARRSGRLFHDPSLRMRARHAAQATVRVPGGTGGQGAMLFEGLDRPGGLRAPVYREPLRPRLGVSVGNGKIQGGTYHATVESPAGEVLYHFTVEQLDHGWDWTVWVPGAPVSSAQHGRAGTVQGAMREAEAAAS